MSEAIDYSIFVRQDGEGLSQMSLAVDGIDCAACIADIENGLKTLPGVVRARLNYSTHRLTVAWTPDRETPAAVVARLEELGYRAHPFTAAAEEREARHARWLLRCLGVAGFAAMNVMLLSVSVWSGNVTDITPETRDFFHWISALIALPAAAYAGQPFFQSAIRAIRNGSLNMDVPITIGVMLALGMSVVETALHREHAYFDSALMLLFFLLAGRYLDHEARRRTRAVAGNIAALRGEMAHRLDEKGLTLVPVQALAAGDRILVPTGERVAADGVVESGLSSVNESLITGETLPRQVKAGANVFAGSLNGEGALTIRVTAGGENTLVDDVQRLLDGALTAKGAYVRLADRVSRLYAPVVHLTALLSATGWLLAGADAHYAVMIAVAVLIITCPCALALAVPAVQVAATGRLFRAGILVNAGDMLERLSGVDTVVFDKTGTLTLPEPRLRIPDAARRADVALAARLALSSHHPLARTLAAEADDGPLEGATEMPGEGVRALVDGAEARLGSLAFCEVAPDPDLPGTASLLAFRHGERAFVMGVDQVLRPDAVEVVEALKSLGLDLRILSGDREAAVAPVAARLGISAYAAGVKPAGKIAALDALKAEGRRVLMVGDGLNDAPALAAATASLSPASGAAVTQAHADAVFLGRRLQPVLTTVEGARFAARLMRENLGLAVIYNVVAIPLAVAGYVTPLVAALAMSGSSILVTVNALRAARPRRKDEAADQVQDAAGEEAAGRPSGEGVPA